VDVPVAVLVCKLRQHGLVEAYALLSALRSTHELCVCSRRQLQFNSTRLSEHTVSVNLLRVAAASTELKLEIGICV